MKKSHSWCKYSGTKMKWKLANRFKKVTKPKNSKKKILPYVVEFFSGRARRSRDGLMESYTCHHRLVVDPRTPSQPPGGSAQIGVSPEGGGEFWHYIVTWKYHITWWVITWRYDRGHFAFTLSQRILVWLVTTFTKARLVTFWRTNKLCLTTAEKHNRKFQ